VDAGELETVLDRQGPTLLFLHDPGCPISLIAHYEVAAVDGEVALIDVRSSPALSREVEQRTGIKHESPQAIVLREGQAVWSASHFGVTAEEIEAALGC
jgi:bacillithiol system protein YtxJ